MFPNKYTFKTVLYGLALFAVLSCRQEAGTSGGARDDKEERVALVIHGGAGTILRKNLSPEREAQYRSVLEKALDTGYAVLQRGGSSLDAVERVVVMLEDSPLFNAGKGAVFTSDGRNELDASVMDGQSLNAGAVAGVTTVKNPVSLARAVMERSEHVMLAREGAEAFAREQGLEMVPEGYFHTGERMRALKAVQEKARRENRKQQASAYDPFIRDSKYGTVGCVALDRKGNLAAATSTGGMTNKRWGRIGDSPVIGAGTYANNNTCAVSSTGWGEFFIRGVVAYDISALMEYRGHTLEQAAREVIRKKLPEMGGNGGIIAVDHKGNIVMEFNTPGMYRAGIGADGQKHIGIFGED
ncbi:isoaspartyl peptidase/L-asparaginase family protein [Sinomicrobium soli]|uniref:isoaspartyl peptidase/L-asparaginase family protein n=1 Tax=Sinomicrobium sp. N-1-3-6 TaxID=2219864 RepID=UPI000DCE58F5|nr:isoaspartyl peptidase/L-asparaginase [Sinomicrobium sp. N-1-3-6]RAV28159.1 beta-aspartyl-peptidase [Sinomicrobium sp. N-1-3-6]